MLDQVKSDLQSRLPLELVEALLSSYQEMKQNYLLERHEPSELNGGKFVEVCVRILQHETSGTYTPIGTPVNDMIGRLRGFEAVPAASSNESYRIHIPRALPTIYNIRNRRGVGHLGGDVNPNHADATLLISCADWVLAELFRVHYQCSLVEAQTVVDALVDRQLVLVHDLANIKRVLLPGLSFKDQTLLLLASEHPTEVPESSLLAWIEPSDRSGYRRRVLHRLHQERLIEHRASGCCCILPTGLRYVESQYADWLKGLARNFD